MTKCVLCGKARAENEMRPLINVDELAVGNALSDADEQAGVEAEREVGGAVLQVVCRSCWHAILESKEKADVIEMLETLCGLLFEVERRRQEEREYHLRRIDGNPLLDPAIIEKSRPGIPFPRTSPIAPQGPWRTPVGDSSQKWIVGGTAGGAISLTSGSMSALGAQWDMTFGSPDTNGSTDNNSY